MMSPHFPNLKKTLSPFGRCLLLTGLATMATACGGGGSGPSMSADELAELTAQSEAFSGQSIDSLRQNDDAMAAGGQLFSAHCAGCHGADGTGSRGVPDLVNGRYDYGDSVDAIRTTIAAGRISEMPGLGGDYGEVELGQIVSYVDTFRTGAPLEEYELRGQGFYEETCAACHGPDGRGQTEIGASDLTDDYFQHGDSMMNVRLAITRGETSVSPPYADVLTPTEIEILTAYVLNL